MTKNFTFSAKIWLYPGKAGWYFVTVPVETTKEIDDLFAMSKRGWGSLSVIALIGQTQWRTSIFPDKKSASYLLPLKAAVRKTERLQEDDSVQVSLEIKD